MNEWLESHRTLVFGVVGALIAAALGGVALKAQPAASITVEPPPPTAEPAPTSTAGPLRVYVSGAVEEPDVYTLPPGAIVRDLLAAAGGPTGDADLAHINLAQPVQDGGHVHVPVVGEEPTPAPAAAGPASGGAAEPSLDGPLDINTATAAELELLPGIGPALAQRIVEHREAYGPFASPDQIQNVSGIGPAKYEAMKDLIVTGP